MKASFATTGMAAMALGAGCAWTFGGDSSDFGPGDAGALDASQVSPDAPPFNGEVSLASFDVIRCNGSSFDLSDITRATNSDYVDIRQQLTPRFYFDAGADADSGLADGPIEIIGRDGTACATAIDPEKCKADLAAASPAGGILVGYGFAGNIYEALARTKGNDVSIFRSGPEIATFLGTVDSEVKAWIVAQTKLYTIACNQPGARAVEGGYEVIATRDDCPNFDRYLLRIARDGTVTVLRSEEVILGTTCGEGRRPEGLAPAKPSRRGGPVGRYFAHVAYLEAASISAFHILREELALHGAPLGLRRRAARAARDEARHARMTSRIAKRFGADPPESPMVTPRAARSLEEIALENATEGCVRETFAALLAAYKAAHARDRRIAAVMRVIAQDETRHAALAWDIANWLDGMLSDESKARVRVARRAAAQQVLQEAALPVDRALLEQVGYPSSQEGARLAAGLAANLWG